MVSQPQSVAPNNDGNVTEDKQSLYGNWMIVKRKHRKNISSNNVNGNAHLMGKAIKTNHERKEKGNAKIFASDSHAKVSGSSKPNKDPTLTNRDSRKKQPSSTNKRQRHELDSTCFPSQRELSNMVQAVKSNTNAHNTTEGNGGSQCNYQPVIYDLGRGARSTVKMHTVSDSRFLLLPDDEEGRDDNGVKHTFKEVPINTFHASQDMVPETQDNTVSMAL